MSDAIRLPVSIFVRGGGAVKVKRGGTGKASNNGDRPRRFYTPNRTAHPNNSAAIWNPADPFIIQFQHSHKRPVAAWRTGTRVCAAVPVDPAAEKDLRPKRKRRKRTRTHYDYRSPRRRYEVVFSGDSCDA